MSEPLPRRLVPLVTVLDHRGVPAGRPEGARRMSLRQAIDREWESDTHFQAGHAVDSTRFSKDLGARVEMSTLAIDLDPPDHFVDNSWRAQTYLYTRMLFNVHPGGFFYETRSGARIVYAVERFDIFDAATAQAWAQRYLTTLAYLNRVFALVGDVSCHDYTRLFRLPIVTRPPEPKPVRRGTMGEPENLGAFTFTPTDADRATAEAKTPRVFRELLSRPPSGTVTPAAPPRPMGDVVLTQGLLHALLAARGHILGQHDNGDGDPAFRVRCPRAHRHTTGDAEAVLYTPRAGGPGALHCFHNGCSNLGADDWLREFSEAERGAAGIRQGVISKVFIDAHEARGVRLCAELKPTSGAIHYVRVSAGTPAWSALWAAAGVEMPSDTDAAGDLGAAVNELKGRALAVEFDGAKTRRIMSAIEQGPVAA